ncbi:MAG: tetratricopeptide repeat protein [Gemmatimonadetes bacterium]|nr:tetratricopeptide repeat protein [Gemmatimonadota bacterium]
MRRSLSSIAVIIAGVVAALPTEATAQAGLVARDSATLEQRTDSLRAVLQGRGGAVPDSAQLANALHRLGLLHWSRNRYDSALVHMEHARDIRRATGDRRGLGQVLNSIGATYYQLGIFEQALDAYLEAMTLRREEHDTAGMARTLTNIGKTYHDWGQFDRAQRMLDSAVLLAQAVDSGAVLGYAQNSLVMLNIDRRDFAQARRHLRESIEAYRGGRIVTPADSASGWSLNTAAEGLLLVHEGRPRDGAALLSTLLAIGVRQGSVRGQARANLYLGEAYRAMGDAAKARAALEKALAFSRQASQRVLALVALRQLVEIEEASGRTASALRLLHAHVALRDSLFSQATTQRIVTLESRAAQERAQRELARLRENEHVQTAVIARQRAIGMLGALVLLLAVSLLAIVAYYNQKVNSRSAEVLRANADLAAVNTELRAALADVRTLSGLIPICASCKKVRDDQGYWNSVESYISSHSDARFSHGICHTCAVELYGEETAREILDTQDPAPR